MEEQNLISALESLLLVSERPIPVKDMLEAFAGSADEPGITAALGSLKASYERPGCGIRLREAAGGWQMHTPQENSEIIKNLLKMKPQKLSPAAMEALAIIAYRQPVTRPEIEEIRGVDCGGVLKVLLDRRLIRILGKKDEVGRPFIYGTTRDFLEFFSLKDLSALPTLKDFEQLSRELGEQIGQEEGAPAASQDGQPAASTEAAATEGAVAAIQEAEEAVQEVSKEDEALGGELMTELNDAISRLDTTRKDVVEKLGLKEGTQAEGAQDAIAGTSNAGNAEGSEQSPAAPAAVHENTPQSGSEPPAEG
jgi:segregation and condensation protein B